MQVLISPIQSLKSIQNISIQIVVCLILQGYVKIYAQNLKINNTYLLKTANEKLSRKDYYDAIPDFEQLAKENPENNEIMYKYGICIAESGKNPINAIPFLKIALKNNYHQAAFYLAKVYFGYMQFDSAHDYASKFQKIEKNNTNMLKEAALLINNIFDAMLIMNIPTNIKVYNIGESVNSAFADYAPIIKADNSILYFTSKREDSKGNKQDENHQYYEDIYISKNIDDLFETAENAGTPLNTKEHDATVALSADGNLMILYRTDPYSGAGDLYFSNNENNTWSNPIKMGLNINSEYQETSASLSADGNTLYFSSNRPGGMGGFDIYKSNKSKNGVWGTAINLGSQINTKFDEESPCINSEGNVIYFSSKGINPNMGGFDVFKSETDQYDKWQKPKNMGFPINTVKDDIYFTITANAANGYICSNRIDTKGDLDIYGFELDEKKPNVTLFKGIVKNSKDNKPIGSDIEIWDRDTNKTLFKSKGNEATGEFLLILNNDKNLKIIFESNNNTYIEIKDASAGKNFILLNKEIELTVDK